MDKQVRMGGTWKKTKTEGIVSLPTCCKDKGV